MNWGLITDSWRLKVLAVGLAVLMLGAVAFSQNPPTTKSLTVSLNYTVPPNIILINPPTKTTVTYSGLADVISRVDSSNLVASVDATRALPGSAVSLNVTARPLLSGVTVQQPPPIAVQVDTRQVRELPVVVVARAAPGWSVNKTLAICPGASIPNPCKVHFDGPVSWETNIAASASLPGQVNVGTIDSPNQPVQVSNSNGLIDLTSCRTQPCATVDVIAVNLHIEASPGASSSTVPLVDATPTHPPPSGYRVTGISIGQPPFLSVASLGLAREILEHKHARKSIVLPFPVVTNQTVKSGATVFPNLPDSFFADFTDSGPKATVALCVQAALKGTPCPGTLKVRLP